MKTKVQSLRLGFAALLIATAVQSLVAAPPQTGIRGQTIIYEPGFAVEIAPGVWIGIGGFYFGSTASFSVLSAHSGREVTHVTSDIDGSFEVSLPPGHYIVVPDAHPLLSPLTDSFEVSVTAKHFADISIYYLPGQISFGPDSP